MSTYTLFSKKKNQTQFEFEAQEDSLPAIITELGKWLGVEAMSLDPNIAAEEDFPPEGTRTFYIFKGKSVADGVLTGEVTITYKRFVR